MTPPPAEMLSDDVIQQIKAIAERPWETHPMLWTVRLSPPTAKLLLAAADSWNRRPTPPPAPELMRLAEAWVARVTAILAHGASGTAHDARDAFTAALGRPGQGDEK